MFKDIYRSMYEISVVGFLFFFFFSLRPMIENSDAAWKKIIFYLIKKYKL